MSTHLPVWQDLLTPMGNYTDAQLMWSDAVLAAKYIPAGVEYAVKSLPDLLEEARDVVKTDWSNAAGMEKLVCRMPGAAVRCAWHAVQAWEHAGPLHVSARHAVQDRARHGTLHA